MSILIMKPAATRYFVMPPTVSKVAWARQDQRHNGISSAACLPTRYLRIGDDTTLEHAIIPKIRFDKDYLFFGESLKKSLVNIVFVACWVVMAACLAFEGMILAFEGFPYYAHLGLLTCILGFVWILTGLSCFFYRRWPVLSVVGGPTILLVNSIDLWQRDPGIHYLEWFLYMHSVEVLFIVASCTGAIVMSRFRASSKERTTAYDLN